MTRKQVVAKTKYWQEQLGLRNWDINIYFDLKNKSKNEKGNFITAAHTDAHYQYKLGSISFNPKMLSDIDEGVVVHELLHCLMSPMGGYEFKTKDEQYGFEYHTEMVTSEIERIIMRLKNRT